MKITDSLQNYLENIGHFKSRLLISDIVIIVQ